MGEAASGGKSTDATVLATARTSPPLRHVANARDFEPLRLVHDSVAGVLDIGVGFVFNQGWYVLQESVSSPSDLLLDDPKVSNNGIS